MSTRPLTTAASAVASLQAELRLDQRTRLIKPGSRRQSHVSGAGFAERIEAARTDLGRSITADDTVVLLMRPWPKGVVALLSLLRIVPWWY